MPCARVDDGCESAGASEDGRLAESAHLVEAGPLAVRASALVELCQHRGGEEGQHEQLRWCGYEQGWTISCDRMRGYPKRMCQNSDSSKQNAGSVQHL